MKTNVLYYGDNLEVLHRYIDNDSIDLIYIDPPFFSSKAYEIIYGDAKEVRMFEDRWKGDVYHYVDWMMPRLALMREKLKPTGSIYVHLDWHAVYHIKIAIDRIFGSGNFQNDIIWCYETSGKSKRRFSRKHDNILFYTKTNRYTFNIKAVAIPRKRGKHMVTGTDEDGRQYEEKRDRRSGKVYRWYFDEGRLPLDYWTDIQFMNRSEAQREGYPTQKPEALLNRIVQASSNRGDIVADFFCGCGTTLAVAQKLGRKWIGCDVSPTALRLVKDRLINKCGASDIEEIGVPKSMEQLKAMAHFEFQNYVISFIQGINNPKLTGEGGIDGWTVFNRYPIQVKQSEHIGRPEIQKFESAVRAEKKAKGYFFAFSFSKPAYEEVARCKQEEGTEIALLQVQELMTADPTPSIL